MKRAKIQAIMQHAYSSEAPPIVLGGDPGIDKFRVDAIGECPLMRKTRRRQPVAQFLAAVRNPCIVDICNFVTHDPEGFIIMKVCAAARRFSKLNGVLSQPIR